MTRTKMTEPYQFSAPVRAFQRQAMEHARELARRETPAQRLASNRALEAATLKQMGYSLEETAKLMKCSLAAVKAGLSVWGMK